ncbi:quinone oxidoreductase, putative [Talaromyces stipitatus ATCC 10500]|uniref:Quinone oxidoreductase, putative n=1 Tax=Talaromyces stipitatus (strain ATCC 10500 / CBS 375.48 / QM 6759 / NRRL 1006) TaxID=441959 RepID=B8MT50_TALSN|nr:quinone oxidoreductase, putative [Talaromyces stipitatus ATCC 10500]EED12253.1 quinone oxidoreductase, putative [Talaromyces stipitatus ATCC 10500]
MKEVIVSPTLPEVTARVQDGPIPSIGPDEILVKVVIAASNPKDYRHLYITQKSVNSGDDVAGYVSSIGKDVKTTGEFRIGDRVAGFHKMLLPGGAYAEYAVVPAHTAFIIPDNILFEEASTIPLTILAAALPLFRRQNLPAPWIGRSKNAEPLPLIVYGASSALGTFAIKLALLANIHPIIAICGATKSGLTSLLKSELGDTIVDYRPGVDAMKTAVKEALNGLKSYHALDAISENDSWIPISQLLSPGGHLSVVQGGPPDKYSKPSIPTEVNIGYTYVGSAHYGAFNSSMLNQPADKDSVVKDIDFAYVLMRYVARELANGNLSGHPWEVISGGLEGVESGLRKLQHGEAKGVKYIYRIAETRGVTSESDTL